MAGKFKRRGPGAVVLAHEWREKYQWACMVATVEVSPN
jgi:hypothetical protein